MATQQIEAKVTIEIPDNLVLIEKVRLRELEEKEFAGQTFTMKDFVSRSNRSSVWLRNKILNNPKLIKKLDVENGGWVYYPYSQSDRWLFKSKGLIEFIDNDLWKFLGGSK
ncbi:DUF771 domain-containing protein [Enterococcus xiangfangensis]|uniref:DUF771 domain-containing protein n=1 Tax=Enterococcus xiangfangensis TaxID=1296537 RepID=UPI003D173698|nr:DUF771 domain-containing protein [Enterococcus asini]